MSASRARSDVPPASGEALKKMPADSSLKSVLIYTYGFYNDIRATCEQICERHGEVAQTGFGVMKVTNLFGPDANQWVLQNRDGIFSSYHGWRWILDRVFPGAIMSMDGDQHRFQRRIMQQAFKKPALESYMDQMQPEIARGLVTWHQQRDFAFYDHIKTLTLDLAASVFMGMALGEKTDAMNQAFVDTVEASIAPVRWPLPGTSMAKGVKGREYLVELFNSMLPEKKARTTPDFFSQFCHAETEEGSRFTDQEIIDHMIFLMMAAHDTTTSTLTTMVYALAKHPEWQDRARREVLALNQRFLAFEDLERLQVLDWIMKEALRMYPPLPTMPRMVMADTSFRGYYLPKDSLVSISPIHTHYMKTLWSHPEHFDPLRFSPGREEHKHHQFAWIPFGGGPHMCIGQHFASIQVKCIMNQLLKLYWWDVEPGYEMPYQLVPIAKPKDGLPVNLHHL
ncbi:MAG: cytochrome P450 [Ketobacteraceae bacterium]|nr:cytochrome P450 [Ketobacteraceae bacterium]